MLKIKNKYLGKKIVSGRELYILDETLTQNDLLHIKNTISAEYVEDYIVLTLADSIADLNDEPRPDNPTPKRKRKTKVDDKNNEEFKK